MLIFIAGISTTGKSTIVRNLREMNYEAYDTDRDAGGAWYHKITSSRDGEYGKVPERTKEWFDSHEWRVSVNRVKEIAKQAQDGVVFLCGGSANENEIIAFCNKIIWLQTDEETIRHRVNLPREHTYGTKPHELAAIIEGNGRKENEYRERGAVIIDARQPIDKVISDIVATAHAHE